MFAHRIAIMSGWGKFIGTHFAATQAMRSVLALPRGSINCHRSISPTCKYRRSSRVNIIYHSNNLNAYNQVMMKVVMGDSPKMGTKMCGRMCKFKPTIFIFFNHVNLKYLLLYQFKCLIRQFDHCIIIY